MVAVAERRKRFADLSPAQRRLLRLMQQINFGRLTFPVCNGLPDVAALWRVRRTVKFAAREDGGRPERHLADFELRRQQAEMLEALGEIPDGTVVTVEVRHGLPLLAEIEQDYQAA